MGTDNIRGYILAYILVCFCLFIVVLRVTKKWSRGLNVGMDTIKSDTEKMLRMTSTKVRIGN